MGYDETRIDVPLDDRLEKRLEITLNMGLAGLMVSALFITAPIGILSIKLPYTPETDTVPPLRRTCSS